jgi:signal transduction histidine kinase
MSDHHPVARGKRLQMTPPVPAVTLTTDPALLLRVVYNMILNALAATEDRGEVRLRVEPLSDAVDFCLGIARKRASYNLNGYGSARLEDKPPHLDCHGTERI